MRLSPPTTFDNRFRAASTRMLGSASAINRGGLRFAGRRPVGGSDELSRLKSSEIRIQALRRKLEKSRKNNILFPHIRRIRESLSQPNNPMDLVTARCDAMDALANHHGSYEDSTRTAWITGIKSHERYLAIAEEHHLDLDKISPFDRELWGQSLRILGEVRLKPGKKEGNVPGGLPQAERYAKLALWVNPKIGAQLDGLVESIIERYLSAYKEKMQAHRAPHHYEGHLDSALAWAEKLTNKPALKAGVYYTLGAHLVRQGKDLEKARGYLENAVKLLMGPVYKGEKNMLDLEQGQQNILIACNSLLHRLDNPDLLENANTAPAAGPVDAEIPDVTEAEIEEAMDEFQEPKPTLNDADDVIFAASLQVSSDMDEAQAHLGGNLRKVGKLLKDNRDLALSLPEDNPVRGYFHLICGLYYRKKTEGAGDYSGRSLKAFEQADQVFNNYYESVKTSDEPLDLDVIKLWADTKLYQANYHWDSSLTREQAMPLLDQAIKLYKASESEDSIQYASAKLLKGLLLMDSIDSQPERAAKYLWSAVKQLRDYEHQNDEILDTQMEACDTLRRLVSEKLRDEEFLKKVSGEITRLVKIIERRNRRKL